MLKHVLPEHKKYNDLLKNRWNKSKASILTVWGMMDTKAMANDTMDTNMLTISERTDSSRTATASIRSRHGGHLDMKMNMISIEALNMKKDYTGLMGGTLAINRTMDMLLTNGKY